MQAEKGLSEVPQGFSPQSFAFLRKSIQSRWYPRDLEVAAEFVLRQVGEQPFFLYGAGTHTLGLLERWRKAGRFPQLQGILDRNAIPGQLLEGIPVLQPAAILQQAEPLVVLSHAEFEEGMENALLALGFPAEQILSIYRSPDYGALALDLAKKELDRQLGKLPDRQGRKRLAFVNARERRILGERELSDLAGARGWQLVQINMERFPAQQEPWAEGHFDARNSFGLLFELLRRLDADLICVQEHYSSGNYLPAAVALEFPQQKVVGEFYDFLGLTFDDPQVLTRESYWSVEEVQLAVEAERWGIEQLVGIVTKESGPALDDYLQGGRALQFQPHLSRRQYRETGLAAQPPRLVWAGTIAPSQQSAILYGNNQLLGVFRELVEMGYPLTAFSSCSDSEEMENLYADYLQLARQSDFIFHRRIPQEALLDRLAREFDYGLMLGRMAADSQQGISNRVTVSAKMFTYLAAGLPLIAADYYEAMGGWIREHGLGILVDPERLDTLPEQLAAVDYSQLLENVKRFRERFCREKTLPEMLRFFDELLEDGDV